MWVIVDDWAEGFTDVIGPFKRLYECQEFRKLNDGIVNGRIAQLYSPRSYENKKAST